MTWFKVDDKLHDHRKARAAGATAMGVWVLAGSWAADNLTDGFVPTTILPRWGRPRDAKRLTEVGLWYADEQDGEQGWRFHEWGERQPSRAQKLAEREVRAAAGKQGGLASGASRRQKRPDFGEDLAAAGRETAISEPAASHAQANGEPSESALLLVSEGQAQANPKQDASGRLEPPTRPDPTRPIREEEPSRATRSEPDRFDEFWSTYDKKHGRKVAAAKYRLALKKPGITDDLLISAAASYIAWQRQEGKHPQFTKDPARWLNGEHWNDERVARAGQPRTRVQEHLALVQQLVAEEADQPTLPQIGSMR